ncbi:MAG: hypothetical protein ACRENU_10295 [Gemmatimonadaceae bacterium]
MQKETDMTPDVYMKNPALRPTVLVHEVLENVYRPECCALPPTRQDATAEPVARATPRAA